MPVALPEILGSFGGCDCGGNGGSSGSGGIFGHGQSDGDRPSENIALKALAVVLMILAMVASALAIALQKYCAKGVPLLSEKLPFARERENFCSSFYNRISVAFLQQISVLLFTTEFLLHFYNRVEGVPLFTSLYLMR